jgi:hypothetical protein
MELWSGLWSVAEAPPADPGPAINSLKGDLTRTASRGLPRPPVSFAASPDSAWLALTNKRLLAANTARKTNVLVPSIARLPEFSVRRFLMVDWLAAFLAVLSTTDPVYANMPWEVPSGDLAGISVHDSSESESGDPGEFLFKGRLTRPEHNDCAKEHTRFVLIGIDGRTPAYYAYLVDRPICDRTISKKNRRYEYVAQKLSSLSETDGKETSHRDNRLLMRQVRLEGLAGPAMLEVPISFE